MGRWRDSVAMFCLWYTKSCQSNEQHYDTTFCHSWLSHSAVPASSDPVLCSFLLLPIAWKLMVTHYCAHQFHNCSLFLFIYHSVAKKIDKISVWIIADFCSVLLWVKLWEMLLLSQRGLQALYRRRGQDQVTSGFIFPSIILWTLQENTFWGPWRVSILSILFYA